MSERDLYREVVDEVRELVRREAKGKPPKVVLSKEVAATLGRVGAPKDLFDTVPAPAAPPPPIAPAASVKESAESYRARLFSAPVMPAAPELQPGDPSDSLERIAGEVGACCKCGLAAERTKVVPGEGAPQARLVFVGEAPGADEDRQGRPFVGRAGQLLTDIIEKGMKLKRSDVFICNVLKCRPPDNRRPNPDEVDFCEPYLVRQLALIRPTVICALGATAAQTLLRTGALVGQLRGRWHNYHDIPLRVTYHPAYLLRSPGEKAKTWEDIQEVMKLLNGQIPRPF